MAFLQYRTFDGLTNEINASFGTLESQTPSTMTVAVCLRVITDNGSDGRYFAPIGDAPISFFYYSIPSPSESAFYDPGSGAFAEDGPVILPEHDCVIVVVTKNPSSPIEWSYYRFDTETWTHLTSSVTAASTNPFPVTDIDNCVRIGSSFNADLVCVAVWADTKLTTAERETLSVDLASWIALGPDELWRLDQADPANSVVGTSEEWIYGGSGYGALNGDSPLLEEYETPTTLAGVYSGDLQAETLYVGDQPVLKMYVGETQVWGEA